MLGLSYKQQTTNKGEDMKTDYNEIIGMDNDGNFIILDSTFTYGDSFHGATGSIVRIVSGDELEEAESLEGLEEYYEQAWRDIAGYIYGTTDGLTTWVEDNCEELLEELYDDEYYDLVGPYIKETPYRTETIGCGRIFRDNLVTDVWRPDLMEVIAKAEAE